MMGIGRCKDLDEWLVGSGESAETADSKRFVSFLQGGPSSQFLGLNSFEQSSGTRNEVVSKHESSTNL
jgi:hypothetical protein